MARVPQKVKDDAMIKRSIPMAGWAYNAMIDEARREKRDVNAQIALVIERAAAELLSAKREAEPGPSGALRLAA